MAIETARRRFAGLKIFCLPFRNETPNCCPFAFMQRSRRRKSRKPPPDLDFWTVDLPPNSFRSCSSATSGTRVTVAGEIE
jgi:hypothetical protein